MSTTNEKYRDDLTAYLLEVATGNGYLKGTLWTTTSLVVSSRRTHTALQPCNLYRPKPTISR